MGSSLGTAYAGEGLSGGVMLGLAVDMSPRRGNSTQSEMSVARASDDSLPIYTEGHSSFIFVYSIVRTPNFDCASLSKKTMLKRPVGGHEAGTSVMSGSTLR